MGVLSSGVFFMGWVGGGLSSWGSLIRGVFHGVGGWWSFIMGFSHQGCFSWGGWVVVFNSLISGFSHHGCLSLVFLFFSLGGVVVFRQGGLSSGWCLIKAVFCQGLHCVVFLMCGCKPNMSDQSGLSRPPAYWIFEVWL